MGLTPREALPRRWTAPLAERWRDTWAPRIDPRAAFREPPPASLGGLVEVGPRRVRASLFSWPDLSLRGRADVSRAAASGGVAEFQLASACVRALGALSGAPAFLVVRGPGVAHPRRFGLACHLGVLFDLPSAGWDDRCAVGEYEEPPPGLAGAHTFVTDGGEPLAAALRPVAGGRLLFVSPGHRADIWAAVEWVQTLAARTGRPSLKGRV